MVDIQIRISILFPGITFGADLYECDCVICDGVIIWWGRTEPQPTMAELEAVTQQDIDNVILNQKRKTISVTPWQFKKALTRSGAKRNQVNNFVVNPNTGSAELDQDIKDGWVSASEYRRMDDVVLYIQGRLGWTDEEVDALFTLAATL